MFEGEKYMLVGSEKASGAPHRDTGTPTYTSPTAHGQCLLQGPSAVMPVPPGCAVSITVLVCVPKLPATSWGTQ